MITVANSFGELKFVPFGLILKNVAVQIYLPAVSWKSQNLSLIAKVKGKI